MTNRCIYVCHATWVRQGDTEVVFVAPVTEPPHVRPAAAVVRAAGEAEVVRRSVARDFRLMQERSGEPPPLGLRRGIDKRFVLPIRRALDAAPRALCGEGARSAPNRAIY